MNHSRNFVPLPVRIVVGTFGLFALGYGISGYLNADSLVPGFRADAGANHTLAMMFSARNIAIGIVTLLVAFRGVPESIAAIFIVRFLIELQDLINTIASGNRIPISLPALLPVIAFMVIEAIVVVTLFKIIEKRDKAVI